MNKELFVSSTPHETKVGLVEDDLLAEIYLERENEVGLRHRKKSAVCLRAFAPPKASRTDCDEGLRNLIPRALRVGVRFAKADQAGFLIILEMMPGDGHT